MGPVEKGHSPFPSTERAIYGFSVYLGAHIFLGTFLLWAYTPDEWLKHIGFTYFPQKYWAVAIPSLLIVSLLVFLVAYWGVNLTLTAPLDDLRAIRDTWSIPPPTEPSQTSVPALHDVPITEVNIAMFGTRRPEEHSKKDVHR